MFKRLLGKTLNDTFPVGQFCIPGFFTFREDRDGNGSGLLLLIRDYIHCGRLKILFSPPKLRPL